MGIGPLEALLILVLALIVFGPEKLPGIGRDLGKAVRNFRQATTDVTREINAQMAQIEEETKSAARYVEAEAPQGSQGAIPGPPSVPYGDASSPTSSDGKPKS